MLTIGITTFKYRYEKYLLPLLHYLKDNRHLNIETFIAINGEHKEKFDNNYRSSVLKTISEYENTFPIMFPTFRGLSKLWNSIIINSTEEYILLLNDDVTIVADNFIQHVKACINEYQTSFKINGSWSHVVLKKSEIEALNYFDERLLGIGEEDGDFEWRYNKILGRPFNIALIPGIVNHVDMSHSPINIQAGESGKYSKFNRNILFNHIYSVNPNGQSFGMIGEKLLYNGNKEQYPNEEFFKINKDNL